MKLQGDQHLWCSWPSRVDEVCLLPQDENNFISPFRVIFWLVISDVQARDSAS